MSGINQTAIVCEMPGEAHRFTSSASKKRLRNRKEAELFKVIAEIDEIVQQVSLEELEERLQSLAVDNSTDEII